jgi:hypothetical protein
MGDPDLPVQLLVELEPQSEPIGGRVVDASGRRRAFSGWLELMELLDGARRRPDAHSPGNPSPSDPLEDPRRNRP